MSSASQTLRSAAILLWSGWIAFTCFKRAINPPKDRISFFYNEVGAFNRNPIVRAFSVLIGVIFLLIGIGVVLKW